MNASRRAIRHSRRSGFTLVEVLAALVVIGIVLPVAMSGASLAMRAGSIARHQAEAATLGEAKLTEMVSMTTWSSSGAGGDFGQDFPQYRWTLETAQRDLDVTELLLSVIWKERGEDRSIKVSTLVYVPTTTGTGSGTTP
ncbi:MAG: type secretion system protein [Phycisphaerales bacterium]|nr:type secretion system protein [Phycisphaerales bacterium]